MDILNFLSHCTCPYEGKQVLPELLAGVQYSGPDQHPQRIFHRFKVKLLKCVWSKFILSISTVPHKPSLCKGECHPPAASPYSGVYYQHYEIPHQFNRDIFPVNKSNNGFCLEYLIFPLHEQHDSTSEMGESSHRKGSGYIKVPGRSVA